jgi:predicted Zn finger-like uncharacterized protein
MIVTCDHCGARYKLDDSKISGRGAKITCPRCRHVFVVYKDQAAAGATANAPPATATASVAPAIEPAASPPSTPMAPQLDVHSLDFRKVGIQSWKVKVKIGLVYDFSDYKTLSKYITDGRVTSSDLLSHNGADWTPIGDIEDLKQHFVDVYVAAQVALEAEAARDSVTDFDEDDGPTNIMGMQDLAGTLGAEGASTAAGGSASTAQIGDSAESQSEELFKTGGANDDAPPRFVDPFEQRKKSRERKSSGRRSAAAPAKGGKRPGQAAAAAEQPDEGGGGRSKWLVAVLILISLIGGGGWWFQQQQQQLAVAPPKVQLAPKPPPKAAGAGGIVPEDAGDEVRNDDDWGIAEEPQMIPIVPEEFRNGPTPSGNNAEPPATPAGQATGTAPPPSGSNGGVQYSDMTAADHAQAGWQAYRRSDYSGAAAAFRQAVSMSPGNAEYNGKLGASLMRSGDQAGARSYLQTGASGGYAPAHDFLGDLSAEVGDSAGAVSHYQAYLATGPSDASRVQQKIDRLNGT